MGDPLLEAMLHGEQITKKKNIKDKFDIAAEKWINTYVDSLDLEAQYAQNKLVTPVVKKAQLRAEILAKLKFPELNEPVVTALTFLITYGEEFFDPELYEIMVEEFLAMKNFLEKTDPAAEDFYRWSTLSEEVFEEIIYLALTKFEEGEYALSLSLFALLTALRSDEFEYWYRLGIAAQKCENLDLALRAYEEALKLNPGLIEAKLFQIECLLKKDLLQNAKFELEEAHKSATIISLDETWLSFLKHLEIILADAA